jgi:branched-chain amino acid transport system substrate-binding protein
MHDGMEDTTMTRTGRRAWTMALALALAALAVGPTEAKLEGQVVKLGAIYPVTGKGAEWGEHSKIATEIAVEEINKAGGVGGVPLQVIVQDTGTEVGQAISLARKLILEDKVLEVIGPCFSSEFEALAPMLDRLQTVIVSQCSAKPGLSKLSRWAFRNTLTSDKQLDPAVKVWLDRYKVRTAVILYDSADAVSAAEGSKVLPALLKKYGIEVKDSLTYQTKDIDFSAQLTKIKSLNPGGIALGACYQQAASIVRQARKLGLTQPFLAGACTGSPEFASLVGADGEGSIIGSAGWPDDPRPRNKAFLKAFMERSGGKKPNYGGMRAYDNVYITKLIIEKYGVTNKPGDLELDREKIRKGWAELKGYDGITGLTAMDDVGDGSGKATVLEVKGGGFVKID